MLNLLLARFAPRFAPRRRCARATATDAESALKVTAVIFNRGGEALLVDARELEVSPSAAVGFCII